MKKSRLITAAVALAVCSGALVTGFADAADQTQSCTDGAKKVWKAKAVWGAPYKAADGTTKVLIDYVGWTTAAQTLTTQASVKTYQPNGTLLQTLTSDQGMDYNAGATWFSRNPMNPLSKPGQTKVTLTVGLHGTSDCTVTFVQPSATVPPTSAPTTAAPTAAPTTAAPTTAAPTTAAPTTAAPTTAAPTTAAPTTAAPTTAAPTTAAPTTAAPTTAAPTTAAPTTAAPTTAAPTSAAPTTSAPTTAAPTSSEAAVLQNWGTPYASDEFDYVGLPNSTKWSVFNSTGHAGKGLRRPEQSTVNGSYLRVTGNSLGTTGGMSFKPDRGTTYGRWEARMRVPQRDTEYHPVLIVWPDAGRVAANHCQEIDFSESTTSTTVNKFFLHTGCSSEQTTVSKTMDMTQWHNYAVEWTSSRVTGYIDGVKWFEDTNAANIPRDAAHLTVQLDWFPDGTSTSTSYMDLDWVRVYRP